MPFSQSPRVNPRSAFSVSLVMARNAILRSHPQGCRRSHRLAVLPELFGTRHEASTRLGLRLPGRACRKFGRQYDYSYKSSAYSRPREGVRGIRLVRCYVIGGVRPPVVRVNVWMWCHLAVGFFGQAALQLLHVALQFLPHSLRSRMLFYLPHEQTGGAHCEVL